MTVELSDPEMMRYNRQIVLRGFDFEGQEALKAASVLVVGLGGLGCAAAQYLAAAGVGSMTLLDTRTQAEFAQGHIDGFVNIPVDDLRQRLSEIPLEKPVYVICQSGLRSYIACRILAGRGYDCYNFSGGFRFYDAVVRDRRLTETASACGMDLT